jgi:hypothetical protein
MKRGTYTFIVQSDQSRLVVWLSARGTPIKMAKYVNTPLTYRYELSSELQPSILYELCIGTAGFMDRTLAELPVHYRVGVYSKSDYLFPDDPLVPIDDLSIGSNTIDFQHHVSNFSTYPTRRFRVRLAEKKKQWIRVTARSNGFDPMIYLWQPGSLKEDTTASLHSMGNTKRATIQIDGDTVNIAFCALPIFEEPLSDKQQSTLLSASLAVQVESYESEPTKRFIQRLRDILADPIIGPFSGIVVGGLLTYLFYLRSMARRLVLYKLQYDNTVLQADDALKSSHLRVMRGDELVTEHVGVCRVSIRFHGQRDLREQDVVEPIRLTFGNMSSILRASAKGSVGWKSISIPPENTMAVELTVRHLTNTSSIDVDVFYTQVEPMPITVTGSGRLIDGEIRRDRDRVRSARVWVSIALATFFVIYYPVIWIILLIDSYLVQLPFWLIEVINYAQYLVWLPIAAGVFGYFLYISNWFTDKFRRVLSRLKKNSEQGNLLVFETEPAPKINGQLSVSQSTS